LIELFLGGFNPPKTPLIDIFKETKIEQVLTPAEVPLTVQEKIDQNYYNCKPTRIRADTAECLPERVYTPRVAISTAKTIRSSSGNTYSWGNCTFFAKQQLGWVPNGLGNANTWDDRAPSYGLGVYSTPIVGAVAQTDAGYYGHIAVVRAVHADGTVSISEMNYQGFNVISTRTAPASQFKYIYN